MRTKKLNRFNLNQYFQADQRNGTVYEFRIGDDAMLDCQVTAVERDLVSWFRVDGDFPVILTVGFTPHSADGRAILVITILLFVM
jgi:hypothetical protein